MKRKLKAVIIAAMAFVMLFPFRATAEPLEQYTAVLWSMNIEKSVQNWDTDGIMNRVTYYNIYKFRLLFIPITFKDADNTHIEQW